MKRLSRDRYLSDAELVRFMAAVKARRHRNQPRDHALFALLVNTGIRPSEALRLTAADCHLEGRTPWIRVMRLKKRTPSQFDDLAITPRLAELLKSHAEGLDPEAVLFPISARQAARAFHYYRRQARVRRVKLYVLRHTAATRLYRATRSIELVQAILGHESPDTTAIYAHVPDSVQLERVQTTTAIV